MTLQENKDYIKIVGSRYNRTVPYVCILCFFTQNTPGTQNTKQKLILKHHSLDIDTIG